MNYKKENEKFLDELSIEEAKKYLKENQFEEGSMKPKIESMIQFLDSTNGKTGIITSLKNLKKLTGTYFHE